MQSHYERHKALYKNKATRWYHENRERVNELSRQRRDKARADALTALGGKCVRCGFTDYRALQIDHVAGDAPGENRYRTNCTNLYYRKVAANKGGKYQILCANCNWIKRFENREHGAVNGGRRQRL